MELLTKQVGTGWYVDLGSCYCLSRFVFLLLRPAGSQILPVPLAGSCLAWLCNACARLRKGNPFVAVGKCNP